MDSSSSFCLVEEEDVVIRNGWTPKEEEDICVNLYVEIYIYICMYVCQVHGAGYEYVENKGKQCVMHHID